MNSGTAELIDQFAVETQQHLDEIEPILLQAEWAPPEKTAIAALFRGFHSIKGLARVFDLRGLESLAHHAESLLGEVRAERQALTPDIQGLLLEALDGIRTLREQGIVSGTDTPAPRDLLAALDAAAKAGTATVVTEIPPPLTAAALHDDPDILMYFAEMLGECLRRILRCWSAAPATPIRRARTSTH